jgi:hypothetical protein
VVAGGGGTCCTGTGCCAGGGCQTQHDTGLGQTFFDCLPLDTRTGQEALAAAFAWAGSSGVVFTPSPTCGEGCLCITNGPVATASRSAVFCYASTFTGYVAVTENGSCYAAACPSVGSASTHLWH